VEGAQALERGARLLQLNGFADDLDEVRFILDDGSDAGSRTGDSPGMWCGDSVARRPSRQAPNTTSAVSRLDTAANAWILRGSEALVKALSIP
jgi:hypothetical protein